MAYVTLYPGGGGDVSLGRRGSHTLPDDLTPAQTRDAAIKILITHAHVINEPVDAEVRDIGMHATIRVHKDGSVDVVTTNEHRVDREPAPAPWTPPAALPLPTAADPTQPFVDETTALSAPRRALLEVIMSFADGGVLTLDQTAILGRKPRRQERYPDASLVEVPSADGSTSKTHCVITITDDRVELIDLESTNGTYITREGIERSLQPGAPAEVKDGDTVQLGESAARLQIVHDRSGGS